MTEREHAGRVSPERQRRCHRLRFARDAIVGIRAVVDWPQRRRMKLAAVAGLAAALTVGLTALLDRYTGWW